MPNEFTPASAGQAGSAGNGPLTSSDGQPLNEPNYKELYENLEKKIGAQGQELGEYRSFVNGLSPVLEKLDADPNLIQAILDGNINIGEAKVIEKAHEEVKSGLGKKMYDQMSAEDVAKLVTEKVNEAKKELEANISEVEEAREYENSVNDFIKSTPDFGDYAQAIDSWIDEHPSVTDITVAYYAVKGQMSEREAKKQAGIAEAEAAKNYALNAGGGGGRATYIPQNSNLIDDLISNKSNPNVL